MSERIRELEATVISRSADPFFSNGGSMVPSSSNRAGENEDDINEMADALGSLSIGKQGQAMFYGQSAGANVCG